MTGAELLAAVRGRLHPAGAEPVHEIPADAEPVDYDHCPREQRRRPHAFSDDGSRRCFECGHTTPGRTR
ncbi:hypothetical protein [[Kitasatospora] papulosa]|uniref:hypothetical protein n=1 Tax=[Kitasatospora] papulosa TaxID=1464011 RepID=UPI00368729D2